jgi:cytochrome c553
MGLGLLTFAGAAAQDTTGLPDGPGKDVVLKMCTACHGTEQFTSRRASPDDWAATVQLMVSRGAEGSDQDIDVVTKYLSKNFPLPPAQPAPSTPAPATPATPAPATPTPARPAPPAARIDTHKAARPVLSASAAPAPLSAAELRRYLQPMHGN